MDIRCVMALIWGVKCWFPCPQCLIPEAKQGIFPVNALPRTAADTIAMIQQARKQQRAGDKEEILEAAGLQDVDVCLHIYYHYFPLLLTTSSVECILENS